MTRLAAVSRILLLCTIAAAIPVVLWHRELPRVALACALALAAAALGPRLLRRSGVPLSTGLELIVLLPFSACWGLGEGLALFERIFWWDELAHALGGLAVAALFTSWAPPRFHTSTAPLVAVTILVALGLGAAWELFEFLLDATLGTLTQTGLAETMGDLFFDLAGAGAWAATWAVRRLTRADEGLRRSLQQP